MFKKIFLKLNILLLILMMLMQTGCGKTEEPWTGYTKQSFKMYDGDVEEVTLEFDSTLLGPVYDKFGEDTEIRRMLGRKLWATVTVQVSPPFWGWLFQFDNRIRIVEPKAILEEYREKVRRVAEM